MRSLNDIYEVTWRIDNENDDFTLLSFFEASDPISFDEAIKERGWRKATNEEIQAINRNDTWDRISLPKGHKAISVKRSPTKKRVAVP